MTTICEELDKRITEAKNCPKPSIIKIYLGEKQFSQLISEANRKGYYFKKPTTEKERIEYNGYKVYLVDTENHINVG